MKLENAFYTLEVNPLNGAIEVLGIKGLDENIIGEPRLAANFRLGLPLEGMLCHYIEGMEQAPPSVECHDDTIRVAFSELTSDQGAFAIELTYWITLDGDQIKFRANLVNHTDHAISECWFPRIGGWTKFGEKNNAAMALPGYLNCRHNVKLFDGFPAGRGLGAEAAEWSCDYPGLMMPWVDLHDSASDRGLYLGYHDTTFRFSSWHWYLYPTTSGRPDAWLSPEQAAGEPVGLVFSHVRYPFIKAGERFDTGEFILRVHPGDWHEGAKCYRDWFEQHFDVPTEPSWLRRKRSWFSSIIYQPEDRVVADLPTFSKWAEEAKHSAGIDCHELIGWDRGGLERDYPFYEPEPKLGGREAFRDCLNDINARDEKCLAFVNYNVLDPNTDAFQEKLHAWGHCDQFGQSPNWMAWGESTLLARKAISVRRHRLASVLPELEEMLEGFFLDCVRDGAHGFQIDKVCVGSAIDFNPLLTRKPDEANCEGLVQAIGRLLARCREIDPEFCIASEAVQDRLIPYIQVFYRNSAGYDISPLRYVFPEWTSCQHVSEPFDFQKVNGAVLTGSVIVIEPDSYQGSLGQPLYAALAKYLKQVDAIREELAEIIFLGKYHDCLGAEIDLESGQSTGGGVLQLGGEVMIPGAAATGGALDAEESGPLRYRVHEDAKTGQRAITLANTTAETASYRWRFTHRDVTKARLYAPGDATRTVTASETLTIAPEGLHVIVEEQD